MDQNHLLSDEADYFLNYEEIIKIVPVLKDKLSKEDKDYLSKSFGDDKETNNEIKPIAAKIDEEAKIKNEEEQILRQKEVEEKKRQYKIRQDKETNDRNERESSEREEKNRQYKINQERERKEREEIQERERKEREERQERERKQWDDDEEKRKNIVTETNIKLKNAEKESQRIEIKQKQRLTALNNLWKKMKENKNNENELKKLKEDEILFNNLKITLNNTKLELTNEITQCKLVIEKNKLPKQRPFHYTFN